MSTPTRRGTEAGLAPASPAPLSAGVTPTPLGIAPALLVYPHQRASGPFHIRGEGAAVRLIFRQSRFIIDLEVGFTSPSKDTEEEGDIVELDSDTELAAPHPVGFSPNPPDDDDLDDEDAA